MQERWIHVAAKRPVRQLDNMAKYFTFICFRKVIILLYSWCSYKYQIKNIFIYKENWNKFYYKLFLKNNFEIV